MMKWIRIIAPLVALIVVLGAGYAALGNGQASARQAPYPAVVAAAQPPAPAPTAVPTAVSGTTTATEQPAEAQDGETQDGTADEAKDSANEAKDSTNEAADAAALAAKATVTVDQAKATALAANPGATVVKAELGDENGVIVYSVELSTGVDVKIDAQKGNILNTDQAGSDTNDGAGDTEAPDTPNQ